MFSGDQLAVAVVSEDLIDGELMQIGLLVAGLALWHTWWVTMHPKWLETRLVPMAVYFLGLVVMVHWLTALSFSFFGVPGQLSDGVCCAAGTLGLRGCRTDGGHVRTATHP